MINFEEPQKEEEKSNKTGPKTEFKLVNDNETFKQECENKGKPCVIGFLNNNFLNKKNFDLSMSALEKVLESKKVKSFSFIWVNGTCQTEILNKFNVQVESLPNLAIYYPQKEFFSNLIGIFDSDKIISLMENFLVGKVSLAKLNLNDITFKQIKCEEIQEKNCFCWRG